MVRARRAEDSEQPETELFAVDLVLVAMEEVNELGQAASEGVEDKAQVANDEVFVADWDASDKRGRAGHRPRLGLGDFKRCLKVRNEHVDLGVADLVAAEDYRLGVVQLAPVLPNTVADVDGELDRKLVLSCEQRAIVGECAVEEALARVKQRLVALHYWCTGQELGHGVEEPRKERAHEGAPAYGNMRHLSVGRGDEEVGGVAVQELKDWFEELATKAANAL